MLEVIIPLIFSVFMFIFVIVVVVLSVKGLHQNVAGMLNGHQINITTGYGYARLTVDGAVIDEVNSLYMYTAKLYGSIDGYEIKVNIGRGFCKLRITTFVNGVKQDVLSN